MECAGGAPGMAPWVWPWGRWGGAGVMEWHAGGGFWAVISITGARNPDKAAGFPDRTARNSKQQARNSRQNSSEF